LYVAVKVGGVPAALHFG